MKKFQLLIIFISLYIGTFGQSEEKVFNDVVTAYEALKNQIENENDMYFLQTTEVFYLYSKKKGKIATIEMPKRLYLFDKSYRFPTNIVFSNYTQKIAFLDWWDASKSKTLELSKFKDIGVKVKVDHNNNVLNINLAKTDSIKFTSKNISYNSKYKPLIDAVKELIDNTHSEKLKSFAEDIGACYDKYELKYGRELRNRSIYEYFLNGLVAQRKFNYAYPKESNTICDGPSQGEIIFLSKPYAVISTSSLRELRDPDIDVNSLNASTLFPIIGYDHWNKSFKHFHGVSLFYAIDINSQVVSFANIIGNHSFGVEIHRDNVFTVGYGFTLDGNYDGRIYGTLSLLKLVKGNFAYFKK